MLLFALCLLLLAFCFVLFAFCFWLSDCCFPLCCCFVFCFMRFVLLFESSFFLPTLSLLLQLFALCLHCAAFSFLFLVDYTLLPAGCFWPFCWVDGGGCTATPQHRVGFAFRILSRCNRPSNLSKAATSGKPSMLTAKTKSHRHRKLSGKVVRIIFFANGWGALPTPHPPTHRFFWKTSARTVKHIMSSPDLQ